MGVIVLPGEDRNAIHKGLWQGAFPTPGHGLARDGFTCLVLCAMEHQPEAEAFPGVRVIHCPFDDDPMELPSTKEMAMIERTARYLARRVRRNEQILVTCYAGLNRSGMLTALTLRRATGWSGNEAADLIQKQRQYALSNKRFEAYIRSLPARARF